MRNDWIEIHYLYTDTTVIIDLFHRSFKKYTNSPPQDVSFTKEYYNDLLFLSRAFFFLLCHRYSHALNWVSIVCLFAVLAAFADICYIRSYTLYNNSTLYLFKVSFQMKKERKKETATTATREYICIKMCSCDYRVHVDIKWNRCFWSIFAHF